jgi:isocitrate dehydrogenase (NAD+)
LTKTWFALVRLQTIAEGKKITGDLRGNASTAEYTAEILKKLQ